MIRGKEIVKREGRKGNGNILSEGKRRNIDVEEDN